MEKEYTYNSPSVKKMLDTINKYMAYSEWKEKYETIIKEEIEKHNQEKQQQNK